MGRESLLAADPATRRDLLSPKEVARRLSVSIRTLWRMIERGEFPQPIRWNRKLVRWQTEALEAWCQKVSQAGALTSKGA